MKKDDLRILVIVVIGISVAVFVYPFLHEMGHVLCSFIVGTEVHQLTLFPVPSVLCDVGCVSNTGRVLIGFGGNVFPVIVALLIPRRWFPTWFVRALLLGVSVLAFAISMVSVVFEINPQDDMFQVLKSWEHSEFFILLILGIAVIATILCIVLDKPIKRICKYFEI